MSELSLLERVAQRSGTDPGRAAAIVEGFLARARTAMREGRTIRIPELGMWRLSGTSNGTYTIQFTPSESSATALPIVGQGADTAAHRGVAAEQLATIIARFPDSGLPDIVLDDSPVVHPRHHEPGLLESPDSHRTIDLDSVVRDVSTELGAALTSRRGTGTAADEEGATMPDISDVLARDTLDALPRPVDTDTAIIAAALRFDDSLLPSAAPPPDPVLPDVEFSDGSRDLPAEVMNLVLTDTHQEASPDFDDQALSIPSPHDDRIPLPDLPPAAVAPFEPEVLPQLTADETDVDDEGAEESHSVFEKNRDQLYHPPVIASRWSRMRIAGVTVSVLVVLTVLYLLYSGGVFNPVLPPEWQQRPAPIQEHLRGGMSGPVHAPLPGGISAPPVFPTIPLRPSGVTDDVV